MKKSDDRIVITQGYLLRSKLQTLRIRKSVQPNGKTKHYLTVKQDINGRIIEIEKKISSDDFRDLSEVATAWVSKTRYEIYDSKNKLLWEVDFFKQNEKNYFVMAEVELPDGVENPNGIPEFISNHLIYSVDRLDNRFSSKKLSDITYAQDLLLEIEQVVSPKKAKRKMDAHCR